MREPMTAADRRTTGVGKDIRRAPVLRRHTVALGQTDRRIRRSAQPISPRDGAAESLGGCAYGGDLTVG